MIKYLFVISALLGAAAVAAPSSPGATERVASLSAPAPRAVVTPREQGVDVTLASPRSGAQALTLDAPGSNGQLRGCSDFYVHCRASGLNSIACSIFYLECKTSCLIAHPRRTRAQTAC